MTPFCSQSWTAQDQFVAEKLQNKRDGTFLDIGCHHYQNISNTYYLEKELNWRGVALDLSPEFEADWKIHRPNSQFICCDATCADYDNILKQANMPDVIDYLSLDIEPPRGTLAALKKLFETRYIFRVVTYETDYYRDLSTKEESRELFKARGYVFVKEINRQDDYYIYPHI